MKNQSIDNFITGGMVMTVPDTVVATAFYSPEPDSRYHLIWGNIPDIHSPSEIRFSCSWMQGARGVTIVHSIGDYCHYTYVAEKMRIGDEDAKAIAHFINMINCLDYNPEGLSDYEILPRGIREEYEKEALSNAN